MKRLFPIFLALILLCGCSAQKSDFELPYFSKSARISCRGFEYDCKITYSWQGVEVDVLSTAAKGLNITYNGSELAFSYGDIKISEPNNNFELTNPAIAVFDIVKEVQKLSKSDLEKLNSGHQVCGKTALGEFIAVFGTDYSLQSIEFANRDFIIKFK